MRYFVSIKKTLLSVLAGLSLAAGLSGCLRDDVDAVRPNMPTGKGNGTAFNIRVPGMTAATRADLPENTIGEMVLVLFDADDVFVEAVEADIIETGLGGGLVTQAYAPVSINAGYTVAVVVNASNLLSALLDSYSSDFTLGDFREDFIIRSPYNSPTWQAGQPVGILLPMYGQAKVADTHTPDKAVDVNLTRMHAWMQITVDDPDSDISEVWYYNIYRGGYMVPGTNALTPNLPEDKDGLVGLNMAACNPATKTYGPVSLFEAPAVDASTITKYRNSPYLVLKAKWDGEYYYYRVNMTWDGTVEGTVKGEYMPILRNFKYHIRIKAVNGPGHTDLGDAEKSAGEVSNLMYEVFTEEDTAGAYAAYDGNYILSVDKFSVDISSKGGADYGGKLDVFTNYNYLSGSDGWKATVDPGSEWIRFDGGATSASGAYNQLKTINIYSAEDNPESGSRTGYITIKAGRLSLSVEVYQENPFAHVELVVAPETVSPSQLKFVSWNARKMILGSETVQVLAKWTTPNDRLLVKNVPVTGTGYYNVGFNYDKTGGYDWFGVNETKNYEGESRLFTFRMPLDRRSSAKESSVLEFSSAADPTTLLASLTLDSYYLYARLREVRGGRMVFDSNTFNYFITESNARAELKVDPTTWPQGYTPVPDAWNNYTTYPYDGPAFNDPMLYRGGLTAYFFQNLPTKTREQLGADSVMLRFVLESVPYVAASKETESYEVAAYPTQPMANSYIVAPNTMFGGIPTWQFQNAPGYNHDIASGGEAASGYHEKHDVKVVWSDRPGVVKTVHLQGAGVHGGIFVKTGVEGNAVVALYDKSTSTILWSWHIWVTADKAQIEAGTGPGGKWMDRNMGAMAVDPYVNSVFDNDKWEETRGLYYQWGRKDPLPTQSKFYLDGTTLTTYSSIYESTTAYADLVSSIRNPLYSNNAAEWTGSNGEASWGTGSSKAVYDPCPVGWRVPAEADFPALNSATAFADQMIRITDASGTLELPLNGFRVGSGHGGIGSIGRYWFDSKLSVGMTGIVISSTIYPYYNISSSVLGGYMYAVRCVKDN